MDENKQRIAKSHKYSVVIPVYNSEAIIQQTIARTLAFFEEQEWPVEIILVNDGSRDRSWEIIQEAAQNNPALIAINLLHNFGQHSAVFCGLQHSMGDFVITLDDDLQNPPEEIIHLVDKILDGHDLVIGRFRHKEHASYRRMGSRVIESINRQVFNQPKDFILTNFRIIRRDVVDRICAYRTGYPYISGLVLMFSSSRANVWVEHQPRPVGKSNYNFVRIAKLVSRILFNYSSYPLQIVSTIGFSTAALVFILGLFYFLRGLWLGTNVAGWTTVVVLLSWVSSIQIVIVTIVGEYVVRLVKQFGSSESYYIKEIVNYRG